ncbi:hypothetical protein QFZ75_007942 [Streptomyces sp. V3I8]|uniref:hypothetical protein n=1 Tax=Streptomyces sp. V3I8 TaxID=3042279 RepID=UPI00278A124B|nr:hypothetical protein [Streptomyces sp. V3I8]MDQ1041440.1 hypothetical protein [Streptomyces sp. V3I8]
MSTTRKAVISFLVGFVTVILLTAAAFAFRWFSADLRGEASKREQTIANGAWRLGTYEEFFDLCAAVESTEQKIKNLEAELATKPSADRAERINTSLAALKNTRADSIATYNSKASQEHRTAFQDAALPYTLNNAQETQCAA